MSVSTFFAPAERAGEEEIRRTVDIIQNSPLFRAIEESIDGYLMILNPQRQVLSINKQLWDLLNFENSAEVVGQRPGELIQCVHAHDGPGGCGTGRACSMCGAIASILASRKSNESSIGECTITARKNGDATSFEFRVRSTPVAIGSHTFTVLVFHDISGEKRRQALEQVFFHDVLNTVGGLVGYSSLLGNMGAMDPKQVAEKIVKLSNKLSREIQTQRDLLAAEEGELDIDIGTKSLEEILMTLRINFDAHEALKDRMLVVESAADDIELQTDSALLGRILTNMVKNALEAVRAGETVRVWSSIEDERVIFRVHNPGKISDKISLQIFQRSFSTKSKKGRGLGTYSMKLFGEKYLGGSVGFETSEEDGTVFSISLPLQHSSSGGRHF